MNREEFDQQVRNAMEMVYDSVSLEGHPLARLLAGAIADRQQQAEVLRSRLIRAIEGLKPPQRAARYEGEWRRYRHMRLRYLEGLSPTEIADELAISTRQARRDHQEALDQLCALLWNDYRRQLQSEQPGPADAEGELGPADPQSRQTTLEAELNHLGSLPPAGPTDIRPVVHGVRALVSPLAESRGIALRVSLPADLPPAAINEFALRQALIALFDFALQYPDAGRIELQATEGKEGIELDLDLATRAGEEIDLPSLAQLPPGSTLMVCRSLIEMQGGSFEVARLAPSGLRFLLQLPGAQATTVLIVDDNPDSVRLFRRYLSSTSYRVLQAGNAETALRLARKSRPQVITLDVMMPFQDGWEILRELKRHRETKDIPVIVCSVLQEGALALSLGAVEFLAKPVRPSALLACLQRWAPAPPARSALPAGNASSRPLAGHTFD